MILYHGTSGAKQKVLTILKFGLKRGKRKGRSGLGIYLSDDIESAKQWGGRALTRTRKVAVFQVNIPGGYKKYLVRDYPFGSRLLQSRGYGDNKWGGDWVYRGNGIPRNWIKLVWRGYYTYYG